MKLYDLPPNSFFTLKDNEGNKCRLFLERSDGMYSYCKDAEDNVVHVAAWMDVEVEMLA